MNSEALCVGARVEVCACADQPAGKCARARECIKCACTGSVGPLGPGARPQSFLLPPPGGGRALTLTLCPPEPRPVSERPARPFYSQHPNPHSRFWSRWGSRGGPGASPGVRPTQHSSLSLHHQPLAGSSVLTHPSPCVHGPCYELWG